MFSIKLGMMMSINFIAPFDNYAGVKHQNQSKNLQSSLQPLLAESLGGEYFHSIGTTNPACSASV